LRSEAGSIVSGKLAGGALSKAGGSAARSAVPDPPCNSFVPATAVLMANGSQKLIGDVRIGDVVLATDPTTGKTEKRPVTDVIVGEGDKSLVEITLQTGGARTDTSAITATDGHPFWLQDEKKWVEAKDLHVGSMLQTSAGTHVQVMAIKRWSAHHQRVYNLSVDTTHTYYVLAGDAPVLVHNCKVFRGMEPDSDGAPVVGRSAKKLGVRVEGDNVDVHPSVTGTVSTGEGVSANTKVGGILPHRLPTAFGGRARGVDLYSLEAGDLPEGLVFTPDHGSHGTIGPAFEMPLEQYESLLESTRDLWSRVEPPS
jgi:hypothetical protein